MSYRSLHRGLLTVIFMAQVACAGNAMPEALNASSNTTGSSSTTTQSTSGSSGNSQQFTLDANFSSTMVGTSWSNADTAERFIADFDGDGLSDLMALDPDVLYFSKNIATQFQPAQDLRDDFSAAGGWTSESQTPRIFGDINGDGKADLMGCGYNNLVVNISNGDDTTGQPSFNAQTYFTQADGYPEQDTTPRFLADVNGDGKADAIGINPNGVRVGLSAITTFSKPTVWTSDFVPASGWTSQSATPRMLADVDGDGKADLVGFGPNGIAVAFSNGKAFDDKATIVSVEFVGAGWPSNNSTPRFVADVNGDGLADFIAMDNEGVHVALGNGRRPAAQSYIAYVGYQPNAGWADQTQTPRFVADVNGDKKADFLGFSATSLEVVIAP